MLDTIDAALKEGAARLRDIAERPRLEAEILMAHHLKKPRVWLHAHGNEPMQKSDAYFALIDRRSGGEPIEYITGRANFYDMTLLVGPGVLIPRPETELLVDRAAEIIEKYGCKRICEIGVGSGAVSIALAKKFPDLHIVATDISPHALRWARHNIEKFGLQDRIETVETDVMEGLEGEFDLVVSNPPYIAEDYPLDVSVRREPGRALFGGRNGDELLKRIIQTVKKREIPHLICEMGYDQKEPIRRFCLAEGLKEPLFYKDWAGLDRGFYLCFNDIK